MTSTSATVKYVFQKWKNTARNSSQRTVDSGEETAVGSAYTQSFRSFDPDMSSDMSSSVTTSSSTRYGSRTSFDRRGSTYSHDSMRSSSSYSGSSVYTTDDDDSEEDDDDDDSDSFLSLSEEGDGTDDRDLVGEKDALEPHEAAIGDSPTLGSSDTPSCEACGDPVQVLSWCNLCSITLCDDCWNLQAAHKDIPRNRGRKKHEKTDLRLWEIINSILYPDTDSKRQQELHRENFDTKWFGVEFDETTRKPCFHDYGRYVKLASETGKDPGTQHPSITCFVGETGHGKSTLINALMKINGHIKKSAPPRAPVMGTTMELDVPTSDAVHLFADPITYDTDRPYFYADCEGLSGGNKVPMATRAYQGVKNFRQRRRHAKNQPKNTAGYNGDNSIAWAKPQQRSRQWMVENLYPRVLFTFSDVVCFVTKNFRALESVIAKLIRWADKVFQQSVNQPVLPYAVIVVNAVEVSDPNSNWWNIDLTTNEQLRKRADCIKDDPFMQRAVDKWTSLGKRITNLEGLLMCYYSGIKIVCIPHARESPAVIDRQYKDLYRVIGEGSKKAYDLRIKAGLLMTSEELDIYLRHAFHHFSKSPSKPFNFLAAAFRHNPVPSTFKDHIAKAAIHLMEQLPDSSGTAIFKLLAPLVASCILLDASRNRYPHGGAAVTIFTGYQPFCVEALEEVYEKHWRCEERDRKGRRCANVSTGHSKGHQLEDGKVFAVGEFWSVYMKNGEKEKDNFVKTISSELDRLLNEFSTGQGTPAVALYHRNNVLTQYFGYWNWRGKFNGQSEDLGPLTAHTTCFSCLSGTPVHALHCGHILCDRCAENYSEAPVQCTSLWREIKICPLCSNIDSPWEVPWKYKVRPRNAGLRILSLDGGGIRGIVQLTMLDALEKRIGLGVPIQDFFDLIVGTSAGGIIALALASKRLSVEECIQMFYDFSTTAFTKRTGADMPGIKTLVEATYHSKYETKGIDRILKREFGDDFIFGGKKRPENQDVLKAGVTTTSSSGHPYLVANYNRPLTESLKIPYDFLRAENSHQELKTWEAARATSAAPRYFKSFFHKKTGYTFNDGGLKFNNPVVVADCERKLLWPHLAHKHPDLLLSIGTGFDPTPKPDGDKQGRRRRAKRGALEFAKIVLKIATQQIESSLNCERAWSDFLRSIQMQDEDKAAKYRRLTIQFPNNLPRLDRVDQMPLLREVTEKFCFENPLIDEISTKLIASLFYFRLDGASQTIQAGKRWDCEGAILCRLEPGSDALKKMCKKLERRQENPHPRNSIFYMNEKNRRSATFDSHFSAESAVFQDVAEGKPFEMKIKFTMYGLDDSMRLYLTLSNEECETSLISGFPCRILKEHDYRPLARGGSNNSRPGQRTSSQRGPHQRISSQRAQSFYSANSAASSASSLFGIFRGVGSTKAGGVSNTTL